MGYEEDQNLISQYQISVKELAKRKGGFVLRPIGNEITQLWFRIMKREKILVLGFSTLEILLKSIDVLNLELLTCIYRC